MSAEEEPQGPAPAAPAPSSGGGLESRVERLEREVSEIRAEMRAGMRNPVPEPE